MRRPGLSGLALCGAAISLIAAYAAAGQREKDAQGEKRVLPVEHETQAGASFPERPLVRLEKADKNAAPAPEKADLLAGQWEGTWSSSSNGMGDRLRCTVVKSGDGKYTAAFEATFAKIFTFRSTVTLAAEADGDKWRFRGRQDLGLLWGGVYTYEGYSDGREFYSTYDSTFDKGVFRMKRAATPPDQP